MSEINKISLLNKVNTEKKSCWIPVVEQGESGIFDSKFSGTPFLKEGEKWPCCEGCKKPMQLFVQLNLQDLPENMRAKMPKQEGLIQLFLCTSPDSEFQPELDCDTYEPFNKASLVRFIEPHEFEQAAVLVGIPPIENYFPVKRIVKWEEKEDVRSLEEMGLPDDEHDYICDHSEDFPHVQDGDKLGGFPYWVQGVEYPDCPTCGTQMELVFQLDSEDNLPYMFGDVGCGHITQCPNHPHVLAFGWACC